jgi:hypothetical protein
MLARCRNPNHIGARYYSRRGIAVCERWKQFENFIADMGERPPGKSLDRINNDLGYEPTNCRWATCLEQARNKHTVKLTYDIAVQIALRRMRGKKCSVIARDCAVAESAVYDISSGRSWRDARITAAFLIDLEQDEAWLSDAP